MLLSKILFILSILAVDAYVRPDGNLSFDKTEISVRGRAEGNRLKTKYSVKESGADTREFSLLNDDGVRFFSGKWTWVQNDRNTVTGELKLIQEKDGRINEINPCIIVPLYGAPGITLEVNGKEFKPGAQDSFFKTEAEEFSLILGGGQKITVSAEGGSRLRSEYYDRHQERWVLRFAMSGRCSYKVRISSPSGFNLHQYRHYVISEGEGWVHYEHLKDFASGSALDFSGMGLQDAPAGKYGWLQARDGAFFFEGRPDRSQRFCGMNLCGTANYLTHALADTLIDRTVRMGYNTLRIHHHDDYLPDSENWDRLDYLVAKGIGKGIYFTTDMFVSRKVKASDIGMEGGGNVSGRLYKSLVPIYEPAFEDWCRFSRMFFEHVNPYTGRAYKDEPALNLVSLINEGRLTGCDKLDNPILLEAWHAFGGEGKLTRKSRGFSEFEDYLHREAYTKCSEFLRSIGVKALLTTDNNGHNHLEDRGAAALYDYMDDHYYVDHPKFLGKDWGMPFAINNTNAVLNGGVDALKREFVKTARKPWVITEWNYCGPGRYRSLGGLMCGAQAGANGWDGLWRFAYSHGLEDVESSTRSYPSRFNLATDPINVANERAAVLLFLRGDINDKSQVVLDREKGSLSIATDRTCGLFSCGGSLSAGPLDVTVSGCPATVFVCSLGDEPIPSSSRLLLVHLTDAHGNGAVFADCFRDVIMKWGKGCLLEKGSADIALSLQSPRDYKVYELRADGTRARRIKSSVRGGKLIFRASTDGPSGGRIYYELTKN